MKDTKQTSRVKVWVQTPLWKQALVFIVLFGTLYIIHCLTIGL